MNWRILLIFSVIFSINAYAQIDTSLIYRDFKLSNYNREDKQADSIQNVYNSLPLIEKLSLIDTMSSYNEGKEAKCQYAFVLDGFPCNNLHIQDLSEKDLIKSITFNCFSSSWCSPGAVFLLSKYPEIKLDNYNSNDKQADSIRYAYNSLTLVDKMNLIDQMIKCNESKEVKCSQNYTFILDGFPTGDYAYIRELYKKSLIKKISFTTVSNVSTSSGAVVISTE